MKTTILISIGILLLGVLAILVVTYGSRAPEPEFMRETPVEQPLPPGDDGPVSVSERDAVLGYLNENLGELSPNPEVLGGTFFVTELSIRDGSGTVSYEDGHNAYIADFTYTMTPAGEVSVSTFILRE